MPRLLARYGHFLKPRELDFRIPREKLDLETSIELDLILRGCPDSHECHGVRYYRTGSRKSIKYFCARPIKPILSLFDSFIHGLKKVCIAFPMLVSFRPKLGSQWSSAQPPDQPIKKQTRRVLMRETDFRFRISVKNWVELLLFQANL